MSTATLTGQLLVATPRLGDPNFEGTVVLIVEHDESGTLGVVVNRPTGILVDSVLPGWAQYASEPPVLFEGGPVTPEGALALAALASGRSEADTVGFRVVGGRIGLVDLDTPPELLALALVSLRVFAGYAGWAPEQLLGEIEAGAWYLVDPEPADLFGTEPASLWRSVLRRQSGDLALVSTHPADPSQN